MPSTLSPLRDYTPVEVLERCPDTDRPLTVKLPGGTRAWYQRREDQCMQAAVATLLNTPIEQVPDPRIDARLAAGDEPDTVSRDAAAELETWLAERGLQLVHHATAPIWSGGWIGVSSGVDPFQDHTVVMCEDRQVFDPASNWPCPAGYSVAPATGISSGFTIEALP